MGTESFAFPTHRDPDRFVPRIARRTDVPWPISTLILWQDRARMRAQLAETPLYLLTDMGIDPALIRHECAKPCWKA